MKKNYKIIMIAIFSLFFSAKNAFAIEVIEINGGHVDVFEAFDLSFDYSEYNFDRVLSGGGGANSTATEAEKVAFCNFLASNKPSGCGGTPTSADFSANGCSNPLPGYSSWNSTFNSPCNNHDNCFQSVGGNFDACNRSFQTDMFGVCDEEMSMQGRKAYSNCVTTAAGYHDAVDSFIGEMYFDSAQSTNSCAAWHALREKYCSGE